MIHHEPPAPLLPEGSDAQVVTTEWRRRTAAEYASAAIAQQATLWLIQLGAPPDLIRDGLQVVADELDHSELSAGVADAAGGAAAAPVVGSASLTHPDAGRPGEALLTVILRSFCIGETVAVPLFRMLRQRCSVPVARRALDRVLGDEARHRQLGWDVLDWILLTGGPAVAGQIADQVPAMVDEFVAVHAVSPGAGPPATDLRPEIQAWGLAPAADYATTIATALAHDTSCLAWRREGSSSTGREAVAHDRQMARDRRRAHLRGSCRLPPDQTLEQLTVLPVLDVVFGLLTSAEGLSATPALTLARLVLGSPVPS